MKLFCRTAGNKMYNKNKKILCEAETDNTASQSSRSSFGHNMLLLAQIAAEHNKHVRIRSLTSLELCAALNLHRIDWLIYFALSSVQQHHGVLCAAHSGPSVEPLSDTNLQRRGAASGRRVVLVQRAGSGGPRPGGASTKHSAGSWWLYGSARSEAPALESSQDTQDGTAQPSKRSEPGSVSDYSLPQVWWVPFFSS